MNSEHLLLGLALFNLCAAAAFTDAGQILETEAVNTLVDLGVLEGKEEAKEYSGIPVWSGFNEDV